MVIAWSVDRLGRSLQDLIGFLSELHALGIDLMLHQQGLDTTTPAGKAMFQMMGVFAEFERAMIWERVKAGLERARAQGIIKRRPPNDQFGNRCCEAQGAEEGRPTWSPAQVARFRPLAPRAGSAPGVGTAAFATIRRGGMPRRDKSCWSSGTLIAPMP
jgi:hypothetical protein